MDHVRISKALVDAQHERGEAHRLRVEWQKGKQKLLGGSPHLVTQSSRRISRVNGMDSTSSNGFSHSNQLLQSQLLVAQKHPSPMLSRHAIEHELNILDRTLDESAKYLSAEEAFTNASTVEDPRIGVLD